MMATSFASGLWLGGHLDGTVYPLTLGIGVFAGVHRRVDAGAAARRAALVRAAPR
jgi:hypothetical protein